MHIQPIFKICDAYINGVSEDLLKEVYFFWLYMNENDLFFL